MEPPSWTFSPFVFSTRYPAQCRVTVLHRQHSTECAQPTAAYTKWFFRSCPLIKQQLSKNSIPNSKFATSNYRLIDDICQQ